MLTSAAPKDSSETLRERRAAYRDTELRHFQGRQSLTRECICRPPSAEYLRQLPPVAAAHLAMSATTAGLPQATDDLLLLAVLVDGEVLPLVLQRDGGSVIQVNQEVTVER
jgi:hypothetical protein